VQGGRRTQRSNTAKHSTVKPLDNVDTTDPGSAELNFRQVSTDPPDYELVRPSQLRASFGIQPNIDMKDGRRTTPKSKSFSGADRFPARTMVRTLADDHAGNGLHVSKSGAMNENRRRERNDPLRRQTVVENGGLWPVDHKDVSNVLMSFA